MLEIKIRGLSVETIKKLDGLAKEKGISRNEFLKKHLETLSVVNEMREFESNYRITIEKLIKVLNLNTLVMNKFCEENLIDISEIFNFESEVN